MDGNNNVPQAAPGPRVAQEHCARPQEPPSRTEVRFFQPNGRGMAREVSQIRDLECVMRSLSLSFENFSFNSYVL